MLLLPPGTVKALLLPGLSARIVPHLCFLFIFLVLRHAVKCKRSHEEERRSRGCQEQAYRLWFALGLHAPACLRWIGQAIPLLQLA